MIYGYNKEIGLGFEETIDLIKEELKKEDFGVLTEIDVKKTLKEKLGVDYDNYTILGVCNPSFAYKALQAEKEIGLLLPCNVIIYIKEGKTFISVIDPVGAMSIVNNPALKEIAEEVRKKLKNVVDNMNKH